MPGFAGFGPTFGGGFAHRGRRGCVHGGGGGFVQHGGGGFAHHGGGGFVAHGPVMYGPPIAYGFHGGHRSLDFYSGWFGFHSSWIECMDWIEHCDYLVWHGWQQMLSSSTISISGQRSLLEGMLQQQHGDMDRRELRELTDRILQMNKDLGAGDDGRVSEVTETTTTTTTTTSTNITQQQRYDTANDFLQLLTSSGGMGFSLEQAQQKADDIRQGRQDTFVQTHLESQAAKSESSQQIIQAPPQQMQIQSPQPTPHIMPQPPVPQLQQQPYTPQPQGQSLVTQNRYSSQQAMMSPPQQVQNMQHAYSPLPWVQPQSQQELFTMQQTQQALQSPAPQVHQLTASHEAQTMQSTPLQPQMQGGGSIIQQWGNNRSQPSVPALNTNQNDTATTSTSTTTTTTTDTMTSAMQGMHLGTPDQPQLQSPAPQYQYAPPQVQYQVQSPTPQYRQDSQQAHAQIQNSQPQQQPQLTYPGFDGQPPQQVATFNQWRPSNATQVQTPAAPSNASGQAHSPYPMPHFNMQQPRQQLQQASQQPYQQAPQQMAQQIAPMQSQQQYASTPNQPTMQQPAQANYQGVQQQSTQISRPRLHHETYK